MTPEEARKLDVDPSEDAEYLREIADHWALSLGDPLVAALYRAADALDAYAKLPMTKDGVRVVPGVDTVWAERDFYSRPCEPWELDVVSSDKIEPGAVAQGFAPGNRPDMRTYVGWRVDSCYSSLAAAEAAAKEAT